MSEPLHAHEITPADAAVIRMFAGASFGPNASVTLPSGRKITGAEMARWVESSGPAKPTASSESSYAALARRHKELTPPPPPVQPGITPTVLASALLLGFANGAVVGAVALALDLPFWPWALGSFGVNVVIYLIVSVSGRPDGPR